jgi:SAM-dependent methyltransferase
MKEASKTLALLEPDERRLLAGEGIDIGCGDDPVAPHFQPFDRAQGDAADPARHLPPGRTFAVVFSSHCLEHLPDPAAALRAWWRLLRPGGSLVLVVPDAELYEHGYWPSIFNTDHRCRFSLGAGPGTDLRHLAASLPGAFLVTARIQDDGLRRKLIHPPRWPRWMALLANRLRLRTLRHLPGILGALDGLYALLRLPIDQTCRGAVAQILVIVRKEPA